MARMLRSLRRLSATVSRRRRFEAQSSTGDDIRRLAALIGTHREDSEEYLALCLKLGLRRRALQAAAKFDPTCLPPDTKFRLALVGDDQVAALRLLSPEAASGFQRRSGTAAMSRLIALAAPVAPRQTLALVEALDPLHEYRAALALALGSHEECHRTLDDRHISLGPDRWLLASNLAPPAEKIIALNRFLAEHGIGEVCTDDSLGALSVNNLSGRLSAPSGPPGGPLISVVMTTYNSATYLNAAIRSVFQQTHSNVELIVVDDASTDDTARILEDLSRKTVPMRVVRLQKNAGTYAAKNVGLRLAKGEYVAFNDADDWCHPERFSFCLDALRARRNSIAVTCQYVRLSDDGQFVSNKIWPITRWSPNSLMFERKPVLAAIGYFDEVRFGADSEYVTRLRVALGETAHLRLGVPLVFAAHHSESLTNAKETAVEPHRHSGLRVDYQERWTERLLTMIARKESFQLSLATDNTSAAGTSPQEIGFVTDLESAP